MTASHGEGCMWKKTETRSRLEATLAMAEKGGAGLVREFLGGRLLHTKEEEARVCREYMLLGDRTQAHSGSSVRT